jgi:hypothetical protein
MFLQSFVKLGWLLAKYRSLYTLPEVTYSFSLTEISKNNCSMLLRTHFI